VASPALPDNQSDRSATCLENSACVITFLQTRFNLSPQPGEAAEGLTYKLRLLVRTSRRTVDFLLSFVRYGLTKQ
jgi:hypothetical protein